MLTVPKLLVVGLLLKSVQTEMSLADEQWPLSSISNQLCSDWAQLMQITGLGNKHYSGDIRLNSAPHGTPASHPIGVGRPINHVNNKKYGNFVFISSLTGQCAAQKIKKHLQF